MLISYDADFPANLFIYFLVCVVFMRRFFVRLFLCVFWRLFRLFLAFTLGAGTAPTGEEVYGGGAGKVQAASRYGVQESDGLLAGRGE